MRKSRSVFFFMSVVLTVAFLGCGQPTANTGSIRLVNNSAYTITSFYITPTTASDWGANQLGNTLVAPDSSFTVTGIPAGLYDLAANLSGYGAVYHYDAEVKGGYIASWTLSFGRSVSKGPNDLLEQIQE